MAELFEGLLPFRWRDVEVPITKIRVSLAHDLVEHKMQGVDGARVEDTGLAPMRFEVRIPFLNTIVPGKGEKWGVLYPTAFRAFLKAFANKKTGILQHPEFGEIACKPEHFSSELTGDKRAGVEVDVSFVETLQDDDASFLEFPSPIQDVELAALNLDTSDQDLRKIVPGLPKYETSFDDLARGIAAVGDQVALLKQGVAGKLDSMVYRANQIGDSIDRAKNALTWPATKSCEQIKSSAHDLRQNLVRKNRDIVLYVTRAPTTLAALVPQLDGATILDVIKLNPALVASPVIPQATLIRYYAPKVARAA